MSNLDTLKTFGPDNLPDLDVAVLGALELFKGVSLPKLDLTTYRHPLVVGSGNAEATGKIMFERIDAVFASESNYAEKLESITSIDGVVIISASGSKHAPIIAKTAHEQNKPVTLITNTPNSPAAKELGHNHASFEHVFPKNREPYTYNTSTYMGMILSATGENPATIYDFLGTMQNTLNFPDFSKYNKYFLIVPPQFSNMVRMLQVKFIELFGRNIARDVETSQYVRHATTVAPSDELFISFGDENTVWGDPSNRFFVPLPKQADYATMMAVGYFTIAQIQKAYPHYFKDNIAQWAKQVSHLYGQPVTPIVEA